MMKRTTDYKPRDLTHHYQVDYAGIDQPGVLKAVTAFFATRKIDISSLKSEIDPKNNLMKASILIALTDDVSIESIEHDYFELCELIDVQGCIKKISSNLL